MERRSPKHAPPVEPEPAFRRVLVLDADPLARAVVEEILTAERYRVVSTGDPSTAARIVRNDGADFLLVDMGMAVLEAVPRWERRRSDSIQVARSPVAVGYAVLRALENDPRAARYPAVYLKENWSADSQTYRFGVVDSLAKPIEHGLLRERMEAVFLEVEPSEGVAEAVPARSDTPRAPAAIPPAQPRPSTSWPVPGESVPAPAIDVLPKGLRTALVVDGDAEARRFVRDLLTPYQFTIYEAADGEEGLRVALERRPWLIFTEVSMPGIDGFELCRRVRAHAMTRHTPLIFFSAWDDYRERYLGLKLGADDYLSKGASARELLIRIQLILKRYSDVGTRTRRGAGLEGSIELIGAPGMLQMCHLGRFSGLCTVRAGTSRARFGFREGEVISAETGRVHGPEAVYEFLAWTEGLFDFVPGDPGATAPLAEGFDYLLLEGCRRLDDRRRLAEADTDPGIPAAREDRRSRSS